MGAVSGVLAAFLCPTRPRVREASCQPLLLPKNCRSEQPATPASAGHTWALPPEPPRGAASRVGSPGERRATAGACQQPQAPLRDTSAEPPRAAAGAVGGPATAWGPAAAGPRGSCGRGGRWGPAALSWHRGRMALGLEMPPPPLAVPLRGDLHPSGSPTPREDESEPSRGTLPSDRGEQRRHVTPRGPHASDVLSNSIGSLSSPLTESGEPFVFSPG